MDFKRLEYGKTTSKIVLEHKKNRNLDDLESIAILLGGYNKYGRNIDIKQYNRLKAKFELILEQVKTFK
jgi:hypothetical protein